MLTDSDLKKISTLLIQQDKRFDLKLDSRLNKLEARIKQYILDGTAEIVERFEDMINDSHLAKRVDRLEKIHPGGNHPS